MNKINVFILHKWEEAYSHTRNKFFAKVIYFKLKMFLF